MKWLVMVGLGELVEQVGLVVVAGHNLVEEVVVDHNPVVEVAVDHNLVGQEVGHMQVLVAADYNQLVVAVAHILVEAVHSLLVQVVHNQAEVDHIQAEVARNLVEVVLVRILVEVVVHILVEVVVVDSLNKKSEVMKNINPL